MFRSGKYFDCTINCGNTSFPAHKAVICLRNSYFDAAFSNGFKESTTNSICFKYEQPFAVESLLVYLYTQQYPKRETLQEKEKSKSQWHFHFEIFRIADACGVPDLRALAARELGEAIIDRWDSEAFTYIVPLLWEIPCQDAQELRRAFLCEAIVFSGTCKNSDAFYDMVVKNNDFAGEFTRLLMKCFGRIGLVSESYTSQYRAHEMRKNLMLGVHSSPWMVKLYKRKYDQDEW